MSTMKNNTAAKVYVTVPCPFGGESSSRLVALARFHDLSKSEAIAWSDNLRAVNAGLTIHVTRTTVEVL